MIEKIILILLLALAIITIICKQYKRTVIFLGIFSLLSALLYVIYSAPDGNSKPSSDVVYRPFSCCNQKLRYSKYVSYLKPVLNESTDLNNLLEV